MKLSMIIVVVCVAVYLSDCQPAPNSIDDLGTLGGDSSFGLGINEVGNVTGASFISSGDPHSPALHAFRYVDGLGMIDVGTLPGGGLSEGQGINNTILVVGVSFTGGPGGEPVHAFLADNTLSLTDLGDLGGGWSYAWDINDRAQVTGEAANDSLSNRAFLWTRSGGMRDLGSLGGSNSAGRSINENGQVAGESDTANNNAKRAFRYTEGAGLIDLGTLGGNNSSAYGINNSGQVVGESDTDTGIVKFTNKSKRLLTSPIASASHKHAFLWTEGEGMIDLGDLSQSPTSTGRTYSIAYAINNNGVVVGYSKLKDGSGRAFRWTREGGMIDINSLLPRGSGWVLLDAYDINDKGQIVGTGLHNGVTRAYRYNPGITPRTKL